MWKARRRQLGSTDGGHVLRLLFMKKQFHIENMKKKVLKKSNM